MFFLNHDFLKKNRENFSTCGTVVRSQNIFSSLPPSGARGVACPGSDARKIYFFSKKFDENFCLQEGRIWVWGVITRTQKRFHTYFDAENQSGAPQWTRPCAPLNPSTAGFRFTPNWFGWSKNALFRKKSMKISGSRGVVYGSGGS